MEAIIIRQNVQFNEFMLINGHTLGEAHRMELILTGEETTFFDFALRCYLKLN